MDKKWAGEERRNVDWREVTDHMVKVNTTLEELVTKVGKQNGRILKLENWRFFVLGGCAVVVFLVEIIFKK